MLANRIAIIIDKRKSKLAIGVNLSENLISNLINMAKHITRLEESGTVIENKISGGKKSADKIAIETAREHGQKGAIKKKKGGKNKK